MRRTGAYTTATDDFKGTGYSVFAISLAAALISFFAAYAATLSGAPMLFMLGAASINAAICLISGEDMYSGIAKAACPVGIVVMVLALAATF